MHVINLPTQWIGCLLFCSSINHTVLAWMILCDIHVLQFSFVYNCIFIIENACILIYPPRDVIRAVCGICIVTQIIIFFLCKLSCFRKWWNVCVMDYFLWIVISVNALSTCLSVNDVQSSSISLFRYITYLSKSNILYMHVVRYFYLAITNACFKYFKRPRNGSVNKFLICTILLELVENSEWLNILK